MLKHLAFLLPTIMFALPAASAVLTSYQEPGCTYDGNVGKDGKPAGKGTWRCQDGRNYTGSFKNGKFDGQGIYTVAANRENYLSNRSIPTVPNSATWYSRAHSKKAWHTADLPSRKTAKPSSL